MIPGVDDIRFRYHKDCQGWLALNYDEDEYPDVVKEQIVEPINYTYHIVDKIVQGIKDDLKSDDLTIYLSGPSADNFRYRIPYPQKYKGERPDKPLALTDVRNYLIGKYHALTSVGCEADDAIGIFATENPGCVIAAVDKDLRQIAGKHFHLDTKQIVDVTEVEGLRALYTQMLMGDRVDSIIGIKGCGKVTAEKLIGNVHNESVMDRIIRDKYKEHFGADWQSMYRSNFDLLKILRTKEELEEVTKHYTTVSEG